MIGSGKSWQIAIAFVVVSHGYHLEGCRLPLSFHSLFETLSKPDKSNVVVPFTACMFTHEKAPH